MNHDLFSELIENGEIPPEPPNCVIQGGYSEARYTLRSLCTDNGMWALVDMKWTKRLADWIGDRRVLEIMAGKGWLAKALALHGKNIIATDSKEWHKGRNEIFPVKRLSATGAVNRYGKKSQVLLVSWPPYQDKAILEACYLWGQDKPIIYIGEDQGGCTACDAFFERFKPDGNIRRIAIPNWNNIHDNIRIGYYRPSQSGSEK